MADPICVESRADLLGDQTDVVILKILSNSRNERHTNGRSQQSGDATDELCAGVLLVTGRVTVDDVPENEGIEQGKDLVDRGQKQGGEDKRPVIPEITPERGHYLKIT